MDKSRVTNHIIQIKFTHQFLMENLLVALIFVKNISIDKTEHKNFKYRLYNVTDGNPIQGSFLHRP